MQHITGECVWEYSYMNGSFNEYGYGPSCKQGYGKLWIDKQDITGSNYDWGVYNAISNGGNKAGMWRTLTSSEWDYLFNSRTNAQYLWSCGTVNGVQGVIILPDNFSKPSSISWTPKANYSTNNYTTDQWDTLQAIGAVFLPAAGSLNGTGIGGWSINGAYWTSTSHYGTTDRDYDDDCIRYAYALTCIGQWAGVRSQALRYMGLSVRLVQYL